MAVSIDGLKIDAACVLDEEAIRLAIEQLLYKAGVVIMRSDIKFTSPGFDKDRGIIDLKATVTGSRISDL